MICFLMISLQVNVKSFKEKRVVTVFGYKIQLTCSATKEGNEEEEEGDESDDEEKEENDEEANEVDDKAEAGNDKEADEGAIVLI